MVKKEDSLVFQLLFKIGRLLSFGFENEINSTRFVRK